MRTRLVTFLALAFVLRVSAGVLPPEAVGGDKSMGEWSADWWKWVFSCPLAESPLNDTDGACAQNCQPDGPAFFLAGVFIVSGVQHRAFTVPEGKHLFFPLLNAYAGDPLDPPTIEERRDAAAGFIAAYEELHASIGGVLVPNLERSRGPFELVAFSPPSDPQRFYRAVAEAGNAEEGDSP